MKRRAKRAIAVLALALGWPGAGQAVEIEGIRFADDVDVGGQQLPLRGTLVVRRALVVRVYAVAQYGDGVAGSPLAQVPRRIAVVMLRDICGHDLADTVARLATAGEGSPARARLAEYAGRIAAPFAGRECSLRRGDMLSFDWVPGHGIVTRFNGSNLAPPNPDAEVYASLVSAWLGTSP